MSGYVNHVMKYLFTVTGYIGLVHLFVCPEPKYINYILSNTLIIYRFSSGNKMWFENFIRAYKSLRQISDIKVEFQ